jgi:hypothetical protein
MASHVNIIVLSLYFLVAALVGAEITQAALGESVDSVEMDMKTISANNRVTTVQNSYTIHTINSNSTIVREYVSPSGVVFGIAWNGMIHPDLTTLLGTYFGEYQEALKQSPNTPGRRFSQLKTATVVVETWGHMRNVQGRAYVPTLIPKGVDVDEIK